MPRVAALVAGLAAALPLVAASAAFACARAVEEETCTLHEPPSVAVASNSLLHQRQVVERRSVIPGEGPASCCDLLLLHVSASLERGATKSSASATAPSAKPAAAAAPAASPVPQRLLTRPAGGVPTSLASAASASAATAAVAAAVAAPMRPGPADAAAAVGAAPASAKRAGAEEPRPWPAVLWMLQKGGARATSRSEGVGEVCLIIVLVVIFVAIVLLIHNNWDVQAAVDEGRVYAGKAGRVAKKATHAAAVTVEYHTREKPQPDSPVDAGGPAAAAVGSPLAVGAASSWQHVPQAGKEDTQTTQPLSWPRRDPQPPCC